MHNGRLLCALLANSRDHHRHVMRFHSQHCGPISTTQWHGIPGGMVPTRAGVHGAVPCRTPVHHLCPAVLDEQVARQRAAGHHGPELGQRAGAVQPEQHQVHLWGGIQRAVQREGVQWSGQQRCAMFRAALKGTLSSRARHGSCCHRLLSLRLHFLCNRLCHHRGITY